ncbi:MAG TPA: OmpH family outer membrane protein [Candidatus Koribacter sp.]|jgi:outer membrane protein
MNRKFAYIATTLSLALTLGISAQSAPATSAATTTTAAAPAGTQKIAVIELQQVISATNEGQRDLEALQKKYDGKVNELKALKKEVDGLNQQMQTQGDKMNPDAHANLEKEIATKQKSLQRQSEDFQNEAQQEEGAIVDRILQKLAPVLTKYAADNGFGLVIDASQRWPQGPVIWANAAVDISKPVLDQYNQVSGVPAPPKPATTGAALPAPKPAVKPATPAAGTKPQSK